jgi:hypothetical protein
MAGKAECYHVPWTRALGPTSQRLGITPVEAEHYVVGTVQSLVVGDFVESVTQGGTWFDIYAVYRDGLGWFVKVGETDDGLLVMSHHEPERGPLRTASGAMIDVVQRTPSTP